MRSCSPPNDRATCLIWPEGPAELRRHWEARTAPHNSGTGLSLMAPQHGRKERYGWTRRRFNAYAARIPSAPPFVSARLRISVRRLHSCRRSHVARRPVSTTHRQLHLSRPHPRSSLTGAHRTLLTPIRNRRSPPVPDIARTKAVVPQRDAGGAMLRSTKKSVIMLKRACAFQHTVGTGDGNRTRDLSLEGSRVTTTPLPRTSDSSRIPPRRQAPTTAQRHGTALALAWSHGGASSLTRHGAQR